MGRKLWNMNDREGLRRGKRGKGQTGKGERQTADFIRNPCASCGSLFALRPVLTKVNMHVNIAL
ncbi:MAG: hypothetical protein C4532_18445 [Candidatus Abyssobacteria bacterium SURF_17]|uniref:Uncharacterized protein n=1 Tax=Candidatus Abyssobacteria bacterium SURF_17 TaxID=2093361 RepID=A0A419EQ33_9BACT|nr:MAG: hypothetical protein C4532_18445 [Candidatus Abyssubacteria bacterium SURF_17]